MLDNLFTLFQSLLSPRWAMFCVQVPISQTRPLNSDFEVFVRQYGSYVEPREYVTVPEPDLCLSLLLWSEISGHSSPYLADTLDSDF